MYRVRWENGNGASGVFPKHFSDDVTAIIKGAEWVEEMNAKVASDFLPCEDFTYEVFWEDPMDGTIIVGAR